MPIHPAKPDDGRRLSVTRMAHANADTPYRTSDLRRLSTHDHPDALDDFIRNRMGAAGLPGLAAAMIARGELIWAGGYGLANVQTNVPVTPDTPFLLGSVSRTVTAAALMRLYEADAVTIDDDVARFLPFPLTHPRHPGVPLTVRMLLSHTSGIRDYDPTLGLLLSQGDSPLELSRFLDAYLSPHGQLYDAGKHFHPWRPGTGCQDSNVAFALAAYLVEIISGTPFADYCDRNIFSPLGMTHTGWRLADLDLHTVAMPYRRSHGVFSPYGHYGTPAYPASGLRASVNDLAAFLIALACDGRRGNVRILNRETAAFMQTIQYPELGETGGLGLQRLARADRILVGQEACDFGVAASMFFDPASADGVIVLANGNVFERHEEQAVLDVCDYLMDECAHT